MYWHSVFCCWCHGSLRAATSNFRYFFCLCDAPSRCRLVNLCTSSKTLCSSPLITIVPDVDIYVLLCVTRTNEHDRLDKTFQLLAIVPYLRSIPTMSAWLLSMLRDAVRYHVAQHAALQARHCVTPTNEPAEGRLDRRSPPPSAECVYAAKSGTLQEIGWLFKDAKSRHNKLERERPQFGYMVQCGPGAYA